MVAIYKIDCAGKTVVTEKVSYSSLCHPTGHADKSKADGMIRLIP